MRAKAIIEDHSGLSGVPSPAQMRRWLAAIPDPRLRTAELCVRIVDETESAALNLRFRRCADPTNVLSFPAELPADCPVSLLGDLVICAPVVIREALVQHKSADAHWAHMLVHGTLHLLGHDHVDDREAVAMEALETDILVAMGYPAPYTAAEDPPAPTV